MPEPRPVIITSGVNPNPSYDPEPLIAVGGLPTKTEVAGIATVGTADATDEATAIALVNAVKARLNDLITALKA